MFNAEKKTIRESLSTQRGHFIIIVTQLAVDWTLLFEVIQQNHSSDDGQEAARQANAVFHRHVREFLKQEYRADHQQQVRAHVLDRRDRACVEQRQGFIQEDYLHWYADRVAGDQDPKQRMQVGSGGRSVTEQIRNGYAEPLSAENGKRANCITDRDVDQQVARPSTRCQVNDQVQGDENKYETVCHETWNKMQYRHCAVRDTNRWL